MTKSQIRFMPIGNGGKVGVILEAWQEFWEKILKLWYILQWLRC